MRIAIAAIAALALLSAPATAQMGGGRHKGDDKGPASSNAPAKPKVDEKAYQEALKSIPEPKGPVDPWGAMRPADPPKSR